MNGTTSKSITTATAGGNHAAVNLPRRRVLLGAGVAAALAAVTAPAAAEGGPDAGLLRLLAALRTEQAFIDRWNMGDGVPWAEGEAANARWWAVLRKLLPIPALTAEGLRAKAEAVQITIDGMMTEESRDAGHEAALALVCDLVRLVQA
jgi:hypothetical protein